MTAPVQAPKKKEAQQVMRRPFVAGTRMVDKSTYDEVKTLTVSNQTLRTYECDPNGFMSGAYILCEAVTAGNSAAVAFTANGPWAVFETITFNDTNNKPIVGPMSGFDLKICTKYGGYAHSDDPQQSPIYSATTGAGATGGSFTFILRLPVELVHRDAIGSLPNKSASATYDISLTLAPSTAVYSVAPTAQPSVRTRIAQFGWMDPNSVDMKGNPVNQNPPGVQTTQYWAKQTYSFSNGFFSQRLGGIDSLVRNLHFVLDNAGVRTTADTDFPDPFTFQYETALPVQRIKNVWRHMIGEDYGYINAVDTAGGRDSGAYPLPYNKDFGLKPGAETRMGYLPVSSATTLNVSGTFGSAGSNKTLTVLVNKVVPANGDPMVLTGGK
jgi:hypothetical protein